LKQDVRATLVVDPFCGHGTVLAVANALGLDALGVELSPRRCRAARALVVAASELAPGGPERLA
jgi:tRNA G10  N-methylase Trm11